MVPDFEELVGHLIEHLGIFKRRDLTSHRVVLNQKDIRFPRIGVPVESSVGVSRHIDVSRGVHRHSNAFVC